MPLHQGEFTEVFTGLIESECISRGSAQGGTEGHTPLAKQTFRDVIGIKKGTLSKQSSSSRIGPVYLLKGERPGGRNRCWVVAREAPASPEQALATGAVMVQVLNQAASRLLDVCSRLIQGEWQKFEGDGDSLCCREISFRSLIKVGILRQPVGTMQKKKGTLHHPHRLHRDRLRQSA